MKLIMKNSIACLLAIMLMVTVVLPVMTGDEHYTPNYIFDEVEDN
jgi:hypothetical protein